MIGWQLGEHAEWAKFNDFDVTVNVPMLFSVPGVTFKPVNKPGVTFPFKDPFQVGMLSSLYIRLI